MKTTTQKDTEEPKPNPAWPLIFLTHAAAGLFFAYESPGALGPDLATEMGLTNHQIGLLYSAYSVPVFVTIFINGYLHKRLGGPKCVVILSFIIALGVSIVAIAPNFYFMFAGQIIFGAGASPMFLTATFITGKWFGSDTAAKKKISLALGLQFAWLRFLSFAAFMTLPRIDENIGFRTALGTSALVCWSSFAGGVIFYFIYKVKNLHVDTSETDVDVHNMAENVKELVATQEKQIDDIELLSRSKEETVEEGKEAETDKRGVTLTATVNHEETNMETGLMGYEQDEETNKEATTGEKSGEKEEKIEAQWYNIIREGFQTLRGFTAGYWLVLSLMVIFTSDLYTCTAFLTKFLVEQGLASSNENASAITSLVCLSNVLTSPFAGWLSGYTGWRIKYIILGSINLVLIHSLFSFAHSPAFVLAAALGLTQSIMDTNLWPCLIFTVSKKDYRFALSLVTLTYNFGLIVFPIICGSLKDYTHTWLSVNLAFLSAACCAFVLSCALKFVDLRNGSILDLPLIKPKLSKESQ